MTLKLYYDFLSQPSRALFMFLKVAKIPYTACPVSLIKGEHMTDDYEQKNPFKKVPAIEHNGFQLAESIAILRYLSTQYQIPDSWYPKDHQKRAKIDEYLEWQHLNVRTGGAMYFMIKWLYPKLSGKPYSEARLKNYDIKLQESINTIENVFLRNQKFIAGNEISAADIWCACELEQPRSVGYDIFAGHQKLEEWIRRVQEKLQPFYNEAHEQLYTIGKEYPIKPKL